MPRAQDRASSENWDWAEARRICVRVARRYAPGHDAEDIAQEALVRAWRHRAKLRDRNGLAQWLATIVRREAARERARQRPAPPAEISTAEALGNEDAALLATRIEINDAIARLEVPDRLLIALRYERDLTQPAIAELLNMPEGTVKVRLHRAREKLRRALSEA
jgi:RNA polymerase sigma-70 factor (ECF subfamily)